MTFDSILSLIEKLADFLIVWLMLYYIFKNLRKNVKMVLLFKGILIIVALKLISVWCNLTTVSWLLDYIITWGPLALIIIFQPEIRNVLEQLGRSQLLGRHKVLTVDEREKMVYEIMEAVEYLRRNRIGALITIERDNSLAEYIDRAKKLYADISSELLIAIFYEGNPLHDGAAIIQGDKITCAGAVFPTSDSMKISKRLGTRHRAALGISEETDSISVVVSEETGRLSIAVNGELHYNLTNDEGRLLLLEELRPKTLVVDDDTEVEGEKHE
jgi:diadenylate cyclase